MIDNQQKSALELAHRDLFAGLEKAAANLHQAVMCRKWADVASVQCEIAALMRLKRNIEDIMTASRKRTKKEHVHFLQPDGFSPCSQFTRRSRTTIVAADVTCERCMRLIAENAAEAVK